MPAVPALWEEFRLKLSNFGNTCGKSKCTWRVLASTVPISSVEIHLINSTVNMIIIIGIPTVAVSQ